MNMQFGSFSDAILHGAKLRPQGFCALFHDEKSCAVGAGIEAICGTTIGANDTEVQRQFPYLMNEKAMCPACPPSYCPQRVAVVMSHLNDHHRWARERIAQWLRDEVEDHLGYVTISESERSESPAYETVLV